MFTNDSLIFTNEKEPRAKKPETRNQKPGYPNPQTLNPLIKKTTLFRAVFLVIK